MNINDLNDDNYKIPESAPVEISDLQDEDDKTIDEEELEILKLQDEDDKILESALKQREDNDGEDNNSAGVEPAEDENENENEEDDGNAGVEPPLRRSVRDRKEKEIFDPSSYLQTSTEEKKVGFEDHVKNKRSQENMSIICSLNHLTVTRSLNTATQR